VSEPPAGRPPTETTPDPHADLGTADPTADSGAGLLKSSAIMAAGTMVSRLIGFVRTGMLMAAIGFSGLHADTFNIANSVPNMVYILVAGGVFNVVLVPQIVRAMKHDSDQGAAYINRILTLSGLFLLMVTVALVVAAPWVMSLFITGDMLSPDLAEQRQSLVDFARYCLPQVFFYGVFVLIGQILNAHRTFGPMMWAPVANNIVAIVVLAIYLATFGGETGNDAFSSGEELLLGLGSTLGIVVQTAVLIPYLRKAGVRYRPRFDFRGTGLGHTFRLGLWTILFVIANQIAYAVVVRIASSGSAAGALAGQQSVGYTAYTYSYLLLMVPHAIVTVSLVTAALPQLSSLSAQNDLRHVSAELSTTLRHALAVIVPFCATLAVLGPFLAIVAFSWGAASSDRGQMGVTLVAFAPALLLFTVHYVMLRGFYATEDTRTPFFIQCVVAATNIGAAVLLTDPEADPEVAPRLAVAYGIAYLAGATTSMILLRRRLGGLPLGELARFGVRIILASAPAAGVAWLVVWALTEAGVSPDAKVGALLILAAAGVMAVATLVLTARLLRLQEVASIMSTVFGRMRRGG
jgi:putative peptidoglycan lipid II flippase